MTMIDEDVLRAALRAAAEEFSVAPDSVQEIVARASTLEEPRSWLGGRRPGDGVTGGTSTAGDEGPRSRLGRVVRSKGVAVAATLVVLGLVAAVPAALLGGRPTNGSAPSLAQRAGAGPGVPSKTSAANSLSNLDHFGAVGAGSASRTVAPGSAHLPAHGAPTQVQTGSPSLPSGAVGQSSRVEVSGSVGLTVGRGRLQQIIDQLMLLASADGGFVANSDTESGGGSSDTPTFGNVTLQIPENSFSSVVTQVQSFGKVTSLSTKGTDVTGQYVDLQSRIAALQASRDQYLTIMTKASSIGDILSVQNQLDNIQSQIEQLQGQLQVLDNQTTYGTLAVSVTEKGAKPAPEPQPGSGIGSAWHDTVSGFVAGFEWLVRIAGPLLFALLCVAALAFLGIYGWRAARRHTL